MWKKLVCVIIFCSICGYICRSYDCSSFLLLETWLMMIRKSLHKVSINITWSTGSLRHILGNIAWWPWCSIFSSPGLGHVSYCHHFSSFVRPSTFHILIFSSETTEPISTKLCWNDPWVAPFQNCVRWSWLPTKMATKLKIEKRGWNLKKNLLLWNYWANLNQTLLKWSLGGPLSKLCSSAPSCIQDGRHY